MSPWHFKSKVTWSESLENRCHHPENTVRTGCRFNIPSIGTSKPLPTAFGIPGSWCFLELPRHFGFFLHWWISKRRRQKRKQGPRLKPRILVTKKIPGPGFEWTSGRNIFWIWGWQGGSCLYWWCLWVFRVMKSQLQAQWEIVRAW